MSGVDVPALLHDVASCEVWASRLCYVTWPRVGQVRGSVVSGRYSRLDVTVGAGECVSVVEEPCLALEGLVPSRCSWWDHAGWR